jgi:TDG/mug DNA glycosylase family protein
VEGGRILREKVRLFRPAFLAVLGVGAYRLAFQRPKAVLGPQPHTVGGRPLWALPNPSGLNAHFRVEDLGRWYARPLAG